MKNVASKKSASGREAASPAAGPKRSVSATEIERAILLRIARKEYLPSRQIPTCEALAAEFGANKNTVSKAYRSLAERGYLLTRAGFGTFISKRPVRISQDRALDKVTDLLSLAVQDAKLTGLHHAEFRQLVDEVIAQAYGPGSLRIGFIDCNRHDATTLSRDLQVAVSHPIEPLLLNEVLAAPDTFMATYDILAVAITHLASVEEALGIDHQGDSRSRIAGIHIPIDPESLLRVARLRTGTRVGVICDLKPTLVSLTGMVGGCNPGLRISGCIATERASMKRLVQNSDVLIVTPSVTEHVRLDDSQIPVVTLAFRPDLHSVEELSALIAERMPAALRFDRARLPTQNGKA